MSLIKGLGDLTNRLRNYTAVPYNLRQTPSRRSIRRQRLSLVENLDPIPELPEDFLIEDMATVIVDNTRFVGHIADPNDPDKDRLESYTVYQFLADLDSRIQSKDIKTDLAKIKEAKLLVDKEKGDAKEVLLSPIFAEITTYDRFKTKCKEIWQPKEFKDKYYNLTQLRTLAEKGSEYTYMSEMRKAVDNVVNDVIANDNITKHAGAPRDQLVDVRELVSYISFGTIYANKNDDYKAAFRKIQLDPKEDHFTLLNRLKEKISETKIRKEPEITAVMHAKPAPSNKGNERQTTTAGNPTGKVSSSTPQQRFSNQGRNSSGQYRGNNRGRYNNNNYGRTNYRGRGYESNNSGNRIKCAKCGRANHSTNQCISCDYCSRIGHFARECRIKQRDRNQTQGNQSN